MLKSTPKAPVGRALAAAVERVLRPLFRILLRNHMSFKAFLDIAKHTYVEIAASEFGIPGKKQSVSRVALLSGLTRKEVQRLIETPAANDRSEEHTSELQSRRDLVCRLLLEKKKKYRPSQST